MQTPTALPQPQYPHNFPLQNITSVVDALRNGGAVANRAQLGYDIWVVQGFAQNSLLGNPFGASGGDAPPSDAPPPDAPFVLMRAEIADDDVQVTIKSLEAMVSGTPTAQASVPWEIILPVLLRLLESWLAKRGS